MKLRFIILLAGIFYAGFMTATMVDIALAQTKPTISDTIKAEKDRLATEWATKTAAEVKAEIVNLKGSAETKAGAGQVYIEKWSAEEHVRQLNLVKAILGVTDEAAEAMITAQAVTFDGDGNPVFVTVEVKQ